MSKAGPCVKRTINIAQQKCAKKQNLLAYEKQKPEKVSYCKPKQAYVPPITIPVIKKIRICTGAELKRMCAPAPCQCPLEEPRTTLFQRLMRLLMFGMKTMLIAGVIYVTVDAGVWGDSQSTRNLYMSICEVLMPTLVAPKEPAKIVDPACLAEQELFGFSRPDPYCCEKFPIDHESGIYKMKQKWNKIVICSFAAIVAVPAAFKKHVICKIQGPGACPEKKETEKCPESCTC